MSGVASVSVDPDYMGVVKTDGTLWVWGLNSSGFPNWTASEEDLLRPAQLMENVAEVDCSSHMAVVKTDHILWLWGNNVCGQIGNGAWEATVSAPVQVMKDVAQVAVGNGHTIALKTDGSVWGWGVNDMGQAGGDAHHAQDSSGREIRSTPNRLSSRPMPSSPEQMTASRWIGTGFSGPGGATAGVSWEKRRSRTAGSFLFFDTQQAGGVDAHRPRIRYECRELDQRLGP